MVSTPSDEVADARQRLGRRLARLRKDAGYTQCAFAPLTFYSRTTVANVELGRQNVGRDFWRCCDDALDTAGELVAEYDRIEAMRLGDTAYVTPTGPPEVDAA